MKSRSLIVAIVSLASFMVKSQPAISLAGQWTFRADSLGVGEKEHWETKPFKGNIHLPGSTDDIGLGNHLPLFKSALGIRPPKDYPKDADFGMLTRKHKYIGVAWYQKEVVVPQSFKGRQIYLNLERVLWRSKVWVDGKQKGTAIDYLSSPHLHQLGLLRPGKHAITILVDNREIYPIGTLGHSYCPHMQTEWNGVVGKIELMAKPLLALGLVQIIPSFKNGKITIGLQLDNQQSHEQTVYLDFTVKEKKTGKIIATNKSSIAVTNGISSCQKEITLKCRPLGWDEFYPTLYELTTMVSYNGSVQKNTATFGFRDLGTTDKHITINSKKIEYRSSHEGMFFAQTGYPAMGKNYWLQLFDIYKKHGFNAVRFHSACPPEAAFAAADELGLYLQVEFFWLDGWMGYKNMIGGNNDTLNQFVRSELHQALLEYGNHPSMVLVAIGNELGGDFERMGEWIAAEKKQDPRHLYAAGVAHNITTADDFVEYGAKGDILINAGTDWDYAANYTIAKKHNYDAAYRRKDLPEFTHEMGQYVVHPMWSDIVGYKGALAPLNLKYFRMKAKESGVENLDGAFQKASGNLNRIFYKAEIEANLRTKESAGYGLLGMVDYPGQGEALMGWVDPLYKEKNFITPSQFRQYGGSTVPLLRLPKFVWEDGETAHATIEVANYGPSTIKKAILHYSIREGKTIINEGDLPAIDLTQGGITNVGRISEKLLSGIIGKQLNIALNIVGTDYKNNWDLWVFPKPLQERNDGGIVVTSSIDTVLMELKLAKKVLFIANKAGASHNKSYACFSPVFWSGTWFYDQETEVLGALVRNQHPALSLFPTNAELDWQWQPICNNARGFILDDLPKDYQAIIQPIDDYHFGNKLGSLFELKTKDGGSLMVCGYNLSEGLDSNIAAAQLRRSILGYMGSNAFLPKTLVGEDWLLHTFTSKEKLTIRPQGFKTALLYAKAGGNHPLNEGSVPWEKAVDQSFMDDGIDYRVDCDRVSKNGDKMAWAGKKTHIEIRMPSAGLMVLKLHFINLGRSSGPTCEIYCEDAPMVKLEINATDEQWVTLPITRENCLDGKLTIDINTIKGPDAMVSDMVLTPKN